MMNVETQSQIPAIIEKIQNGLVPSQEEIRHVIAAFEGEMMKSDNKLEIPIKHYFSKDAYAREITIPKGTLVVGKIHKFENLNILSKGEITVLSQDGIMRVKAPFTVVSTPGVKRLAFTHEETVWTTILGTNEKDPDKIESEFIAKNYSEVSLASNEKTSIEGGI